MYEPPTPAVQRSLRSEMGLDITKFRPVTFDVYWLMKEIRTWVTANIHVWQAKGYHVVVTELARCLWVTVVGRRGRWLSVTRRLLLLKGLKVDIEKPP